MSFSTEIKNEISRIKSSKSEYIAELSGYARNNLKIKENEIELNTENVNVSKRIISLFKELYDVNVNIKVTKNKFAFIELEEDIINSLKADVSSASNMINEFNNIEEILVWMFISRDEKNDMFRINIRSRGPYINEIASKYHGGGHRYASGVRTKSKEDIEALEAELDELCKQYIKENE